MGQTPTKFVVAEVFEMMFLDTVDGSILAYLSDLKTSGLKNEMTETYAQGGRGNARLAAFSSDKIAMLEVTSATWNTNVMAQQIGTTVVLGDNPNFIHYDRTSALTDGAVTKYTALGDVDAEIVSIQEINSAGSVLNVFTQVTSPAATGEFSYVSGTKAISFFAGDLTDGALIQMQYKASTGATAQTITVNASSEPNIVKMVAYGLIQDVCSGKTFGCEIIADKAKIGGSWDWALAASKEPSEQMLNLEFLKGCSSGKLYEAIIYDEDDIT